MRAVILVVLVAIAIRVPRVSGALGAGAAMFGRLAWLLVAPRIMLAEGHFMNFVQTFVAPLQFSALTLFLQEERRRRRTWLSLAIGVSAGLGGLRSSPAP